MLIEDARGAPASARVGGLQRGNQELASGGSGVLPPRQHHAQRIGGAGLHHLAGVAESLNQGRHGAGIRHVPERAGRGFARQRLIALHQHFADLAQRGLRREVPELVKLGKQQRQVVRGKFRGRRRIGRVPILGLGVVPG